MSLLSAYQEGLSAAKSDYPSHANPYKKWHQYFYRRQWYNGWWDGLSESMRQWLKNKRR